jgi:hypothetical protein
MIARILFTLLLLSIVVSAAEHNYKPANGYVPNEKTAIAIAEAVLTPVYGEDNIRRQRPFQAKLTNSVWIVTGTMKRGHFGGVAQVDISSTDGCIIRMTHGK